MGIVDSRVAEVCLWLVEMSTPWALGAAFMNFLPPT